MKTKYNENKIYIQLYGVPGFFVRVFGVFSATQCGYCNSNCVLKIAMEDPTGNRNKRKEKSVTSVSLLQITPPNEAAFTSIREGRFFVLNF